jgi:hypothetical protein
MLTWLFIGVTLGLHTDWLDTSEYSTHTAHTTFSEGKPTLFIFRPKSTDFSKMTGEVAAALKDELLVVTADLESELGSPLVYSLGVTADKQPCAMIVDQINGLHKYLKLTDLSAESLIDFATQWKLHQLEPFLKSAPAPSEPFEDGVKELVASTFEKEAYNDQRDVFVLFYGHKCDEECTELLQVLKQAADHFQNDYGLLFCKIDVSVNEIRRATITNLPEVQYFASTRPQPELYTGDKSADAFIDFVKKQRRTQQQEL